MKACYYCGSTDQSVSQVKGSRVWVIKRLNVDVLNGERGLYLECDNCYDTNRPYNEAVKIFGVKAVDRKMDELLATKKGV